MEVLIAVLVSLVAGAILLETYAWLPQISSWVLEVAIRRLPQEERERRRIEWQTDIANVPGTLVRVVWAIHCLLKVNKIITALLEAKHEALGDMILELSNRQYEAATSFNAFEDDYQRQRQQLELCVSEAASQATQIGRTVEPVSAAHISLRNLAERTHGLACTLLLAADRAHALLKVSIDRGIPRLDRLGTLIDKAQQQHDDAASLLQNNNAETRQAAETKLNCLFDDLEWIRKDLNADDWEDEETYKEQIRIRSVLEEVVNNTTRALGRLKG